MTIRGIVSLVCVALCSCSTMRVREMYEGEPRDPSEVAYLALDSMNNSKVSRPDIRLVGVDGESISPDWRSESYASVLPGTHEINVLLRGLEDPMERTFKQEVRANEVYDWMRVDDGEDFYVYLGSKNDQRAERAIHFEFLRVEDSSNILRYSIGGPGEDLVYQVSAKAVDWTRIDRDKAVRLSNPPWQHRPSEVDERR